jgi:hypothetical protein
MSQPLHLVREEWQAAKRIDFCALMRFNLVGNLYGSHLVTYFGREGNGLLMVLGKQSEKRKN